MDIFDLKRWIGVISFEERWPGLADKIRELKEAERQALSGPSIADLHQAEMEQFYKRVQREGPRIPDRITFFDEED